MSDQPEPREEFTSGDLAAEFQALGKNLKRIIVDAWQSEERKNLQMELEEGLSDLGDSLKQTAQEIHDSETGQRLKAEAEDLRDRIRTGEVEEKIRNDLQSILRKMNSDLEKVAKPTTSPEEAGQDDPGKE
jgi:hypothetical protein